MPLIDTHCHISGTDFDADRDAMIERMIDAGVSAAVVIGCDDDDYPRLRQTLDAHPGVLFGAWALHPEYENLPDPSLETILERNSQPGMVAVGETGLDFYWCKEPLDWQRRRFRLHIEAARVLNKPLIIHARDAEAQAVEILRETHAGDMGFVLHCYSGDLATAQAAIDAGGLVSFTGSLTFKRNDALRAVCQALPLDKFMLETDSPFMAPVPLRGKRCEPSYVPYIAQVATDLHHVSLAELARITTQTAIDFFNLPRSIAEVEQELVSNTPALGEPSCD